MRGPGPGYAAWLRDLAGPGSPVRLSIAAGDRLAVDEIDLRVLWPIRGQVPTLPPDGGTGINNVSVVLLGQVGERRFLLMGDVEEAIDPSLLADDLPHVDLLKVAHHGSKTATTQPFVDAVRPAVAVASAGAGNPYGHPAKSTLDRLAASGARVLRTDRDGTVVAGFEPGGMTIRTEGARPVAEATPARSAVTGATLASTRTSAFLCAIPITAVVPEATGAEAPGPSRDLTTRQVGHRADWPGRRRSRPRCHRARPPVASSGSAVAPRLDADPEAPERTRATVVPATIGAMTVPGRVEAAALLLSLDPPPWFVRHARAVAEVAGWLAARIEARGTPVDRRLVESAALLHDADKVLPHDDPARALPTAMDRRRG